MASEGGGRAIPFAVGVSLRAAAVAGLLWGAVVLVVRDHYYATALILVALAALLIADIVRLTHAADRMLEAFAEGLAAGVAERPARPPAAFRGLGLAIGRAADRIDAERDLNQRRTDALEAMLDTVSAALFVLRPDGSIERSNRAARNLAREAAGRLADVPAFGRDLGAQLSAMAPGAREIVRLPDGRRMLAAAAVFTLPDGGRRQLVSLQSVSGELDPVEIKAWQDLARILAHEMMNSLTPIVSLAESLGNLPPDDGDAHMAAQVIARRSQGLMNFVDRYRTVAELPSPERAEVRLSELAAGLGALIEPMLKEKGVAFSAEVDPPGLAVTADPQLLEQAVLNLLKNAVDAVEDAADPAIRLSCRLRSDGQAAISVADNGRGLPDDPDGLFVPFFTTKTGGSGIGLSIARQVALAHQGQAIAERGDPGGAVFSIVLPTGGPD
jgi:nitrogen fixation/metabolism regulation signal transduction histidine kinase